ncbi:hypothetical protein [Falsibacillus albus]|uniref:Uncharacterized protein n=1 Tax=Falsibacillus albus TaxID=2478915 RepID=A0A3L7JGN9_9BACI|nr:hypothetical protein [Falsibacillus albus]RLQ89957.1 hypothetical protein D9X91_22185 [Falsibacillus albus]
MKKLLTSVLVVGIATTAWFGFHKDSNVKAESNPVSHQPVLHGASQEDLTADNGILYDGIHNSAIFLVAIAKDITQPSDFDNNKENLDTVLSYEEGAIKMSVEKNADSKIRSTLKEALKTTQEAVDKKDPDLLSKAATILEKLDVDYSNQ